MSQLAGTWVAGDSGKEFQYYVTSGGVPLDVSAATNIVLSLVRRSAGSDVSVVIPGTVISPGTGGGLAWAGANAIGLYVPQPDSRLTADIYEARVSFTLSSGTYWTETFRVAVNRWGLSTVPTSRATLDPGASLQEAVDALGGNGGTIYLGAGTYYADPSSPSTPLTMAGGVELEGVGVHATALGSPALVSGSLSGFRKLWVRPAGTSYGVRIYDGGNPFIARCFFDRVFVGASAAGAGDGPVDGIQIDGAGLILAEQLTCGFNTGNGLLVDSTGMQPNTTLKFDMCSFTLNGGYGVKIMQSSTIAEFDGGSMEDNTTAEFYAESCALVALKHVDFERGSTAGLPTAANVVQMQNVNAFRIEDCSFFKIAAATRAFFIDGSVAGVYEGNRFDSWGAVGVARISETCTNVRRGVNHIVNGGGWIEDYSR